MHLKRHIDIVKAAFGNDFGLTAQVTKLTLFPELIAVIDFDVFFGRNGKKDHITVKVLHDVCIFKGHGNSQQVGNLHIVPAAVRCSRDRVTVRMVAANNGIEFAQKCDRFLRFTSFDASFNTGNAPSVGVAQAKFFKRSFHFG